MRPVLIVLLAAVLALADEGPEAVRVRRVTRAQERRPWIGVTLQALDGDTSALGGAKGEIGIRVTAVVSGAPAEKAGLRADDVLVALEAKPFTGDKEQALDQLRLAISTKKPGDSLSVGFLRGGARQEAKVALAEMPVAESKGRPHPELAAYHDAPEPSVLEKALVEQKLDQGWLLVAKGIADAASQSATQEPLLDDAPDPFRLGEVSYCLTNPLDTHLVVKGIARDLGDAAESGSSPAVLLSALAREADLAPGAGPGAPLVGDTLEALLDDLVARIGEARKEVASGIEGLSEDERREWADLSVLRPGDGASADAVRRYFRLAARVKRDRLAAGAARVLGALGKASILALERVPAPAGQVDPPDGVEGDVVLVKETPIGTVVVGGRGRTIYSRAFPLVVDLGGDDVYEGGCASGSPDLPVSAVIDLGGDDVYRSKKPWTQGAGRLGVGVLLDLAGDDLYDAPSYAQGCGAAGVGVLIDMDGNDTYRADTIAQGAGIAGLGLLVDLAGGDIARVARQGQGYGAAGGAGLLLDAEGDDARYAGGAYKDADNGLTQSMAQGFGFGLPPSPACPLGVSGGMGLLVDLEGNDVYAADDLCQGAGYWFGLGGLYDGRGLDRYVAGRFAQGAAVLNAAGALVEGEGNDTYVCSDVGLGQGCGHGTAVGVLADYEGNDSYHGGSVVQGAGNEGGIGALLDFGGNDSMYAKADAQGRGGSQEGRTTQSFGLIFNLGGTDLYSIGGERTAVDKQVVTRPNWGLILDVEETVHVR